MAIQHDLPQSNFGVSFTGAYFRIVTAAISRQRGGQCSVMIDVVGYAVKPTNDDTRDVDFRRYHAPEAEIEAMVVPTADPSSLFRAKCNAWVMLQPDMAGSIAV